MWRNIFGGILFFCLLCLCLSKKEPSPVDGNGEQDSESMSHSGKRLASLPSYERLVPSVISKVTNYFDRAQGTRRATGTLCCEGLPQEMDKPGQKLSFPLKFSVKYPSGVSVWGLQGCLWGLLR